MVKTIFSSLQLIPIVKIQKKNPTKKKMARFFFEKDNPYIKKNRPNFFSIIFQIFLRLDLTQEN